MNKKFTVVAITGLSLVGLLSGCAGSNENAFNKQSPSPTQSPVESETPVETSDPEGTETEFQEAFPRIDFDAEIVLANNQQELEFLTSALNSCKKAQDDGFVIDSPRGQSIFRSAERGVFPEWPFDEVSIVDGKPGFGQYDDLFSNMYPSLFEPCSLERRARGTNVEDVAIEHKLTKLSSNTFGWSQHHGGASLEQTVFQVKDGLIVAYGDTKTLDSKITYGPLTAEQNALLDQDSNQ